MTLSPYATALQASMTIADDPLAYTTDARRKACTFLRAQGHTKAARAISLVLHLPRRDTPPAPRYGAHSTGTDQVALVNAAWAVQLPMFPTFDRALKLFGRRPQ